MRTIVRVGTLLVLVLVATSFAGAQEIPAEYEERIRDLVERFEEARRLLREQIQINADLYSQAEVDALIADLDARVEDAEARALVVEREYKALLGAFKYAEEEARLAKAELVRTREELQLEVATMETVLNATEVENMFQIGPTFSLDGSLGVLGLFNLPGTNVSLVSQLDYVLREREARTIFGVTFSFVEQGTLVENWERFLARRRNQAAEKALENNSTPLEPVLPVDGATENADDPGQAPAPQ